MNRKPKKISCLNFSAFLSENSRTITNDQSTKTLVENGDLKIEHHNNFFSFSTKKESIVGIEKQRRKEKNISYKNPDYKQLFKS